VLTPGVIDWSQVAEGFLKKVPVEETPASQFCVYVVDGFVVNIALTELRLVQPENI
jgi:hypothetical protein